MKEIFDEYKIRYLWHFTDESNLASIKECNGLLSLATLTHFGIKIPEPGGNESSHRRDRTSGMAQYVHLSFVQNSPMLYHAQKHEKRIPNPRWLGIDVAVTFVKGVWYSTGYTNANDAVLLTEEQAKQTIDFEALFYFGGMEPNTQPKAPGEMWNRYAKACKAEILIPCHVLRENIRKCIKDKPD